VSIDGLVEAAIEGGSFAIESYLEGLNKPEREKDALREEINKLVEVRFIFLTKLTNLFSNGNATWMMMLKKFHSIR
jgi:hypothetical protein